MGRPLTALSSLLLGAFLSTGALAGQAVPPPSPEDDSVTVTPGKDYALGGFLSWLAGSGYRELWTTPIRVPVARLEGPGGILTPVRLGGGTTTRTLHLEDPSGRRYVLRSVDKTPQVLVEELQDTPIEAILQDQISSFHPSGAPVVARLLDEIGVLHVEPTLVVIPDDPRLGEFRDQFAGMLAIFEERPDDLPEGQAGFAGSRRVEQTDALLDELEEGPENRVAIRELLAARLVDILVGDRDRSVNNYLWARFDEDGGGYLWRPIPRDRDQAFVQFDGFLKGLGRLREPRLVRFQAEYPDLRGLTRNAWDIDRNLLVGLDRQGWDETVAAVVAALTDSVIDEAVARLPAAHRAIVGEETARSLRARRDALPVAAEELYRIVFEWADIHATDADEVAVIEQHPTAIRIGLYERGDDGGPDGAPFFDRTFDASETREIRLYLHGGDDLSRVGGDADAPIGVRIVGGGGRDAAINPLGLSGTTLYDGGDNTSIEGGGTRRRDEDATRVYSWFEERRELDWGSVWGTIVGVGYDGDRGAVLSAGLFTERYGFLRQPFSSRVEVEAGWAVSRGQPIVDYRHRLRHALAGADLDLHARYSGIEVINFYGFGNATEVVESSGSSFHQVDQKELILAGAISFGDEEDTALRIGPVVKRLSSDTIGTTRFLAEEDPYGAGEFAEVGLMAEVDVDRRDRGGFPTRGFRIRGTGLHAVEALDVDASFTSVRGEISTYATPWNGPLTFAGRAGGMRVWGEHPFHESAFLGGSENVRGLHEQRFAGDASLYGSAELRLSLGSLRFYFPIDLGVFALTDAGRVFVAGESSERWHSSIGGGVWIAPVLRESTLRVSFARSEGRGAIYFGLGFAF